MPSRWEWGHAFLFCGNAMTPSYPSARKMAPHLRNQLWILSSLSGPIDLAWVGLRPQLTDVLIRTSIEFPDHRYPSPLGLTSDNRILRSIRRAWSGLSQFCSWSKFSECCIRLYPSRRPCTDLHVVHCHPKVWTEIVSLVKKSLEALQNLKVLDLPLLQQP